MKRFIAAICLAAGVIVLTLTGILTAKACSDDLVRITDKAVLYAGSENQKKALEAMNELKKEWDSRETALSFFAGSETVDTISRQIEYSVSVLKNKGTKAFMSEAALLKSMLYELYEDEKPSALLLF